MHLGAPPRDGAVVVVTRRLARIVEPEMARRLAERKTRHLQATGAEAVVTANPGCILQIAAGLRQRGVAMRVLHIAELLDQAYAAGERETAS
jgi:glycolate oxidase iron-sulfur subunit